MDPFVRRQAIRIVKGVAVLALTAAATLTAAPASATETLQRFMRFVGKPAGQERLDTAIVTYHGPRGVKVELVAAVHVADPGYYRALQERFDRYDRLLYEMVKPKDLDLRTAGRAEGGLAGAQRFVQDVLELAYQLDQIDYARPHFVHADVEPKRLLAGLTNNLGAIFGQMLRWSVRDMGRLSYSDGTPRMPTWTLLTSLGRADKARALKLFFARELVDMDADMAALGGNQGAGAVLVAERNQVAIEVLQKTLQQGHKRVGIFYGAAHLPDLEKRLLALGFKPGKTEWLTAWDLRKK